MTRIVNLYKEKYDVYIGRAGRGEDGYFGNPYPLTGDSKQARTDVIQRFKLYFLQRIAIDTEYRARTKALKGKILGCFCAPLGGLTASNKPFICHGQIIAEYLDE